MCLGEDQRQRDELRRETQREMDFAATERLIFFSDAVLAIALTLLAMEHPQPAAGTAREMLHSAGELWPEYLAFVVSFIVISAHWRVHHQVFRYVGGSSRMLVRLNLNWLLLAVITPFTTKLLSEGRINIVRFGAYALAQTLQFTFFALMVAVIRREGLLRDPADRPQLNTPGRRSVVFAVTFAVSIPLYALVGGAAFTAWAALPLLSSLVVRYLEQRRPRRVRR